MKSGQMKQAVESLAGMFARSGDKSTSNALQLFATLLAVEPDDSVSNLAKRLKRKGTLARSRNKRNGEPAPAARR